MKRLLLTLGAVAAYFLLGHAGLLAILAYVWVSAMTSTTNTAKTRDLAAKHAALVTAVGTTNTTVAKATSQAGTVSGHMNTVADTTSGGAIVPGGTPTIQTGTQNGSGTGHTHGYGHEHFLGLTGTLNTIINQVNAIQAALTTAGLI